MKTTHSADGTSIAHDELGSGNPVVLVSGASTARGIHAPLAELLAASHTVLNYDRRGRGDSGDTQPYSVEREIEDLAAVIDAAGGSAAVFGNSSGGVLALRTAAAGVPITRLILWEPPFQLDPDAPRRTEEYVAELTAHLAEGNRGEAAALFMRSIGLPITVIEQMRQSPMWSSMQAIAPTLAYDAAIMGDGSLPSDAADAKIPTLVLTGTETGEWAPAAAEALLEVLPSAQHTILEGQAHNVAWDVLAPHVISFLD